MLYGSHQKNTIHPTSPHPYPNSRPLAPLLRPHQQQQPRRARPAAAPAPPRARRARGAAGADEDPGDGAASDLERQLLGLSYQALVRLARARGASFDVSRPTKGDVLAALLEMLPRQGVDELVRAGGMNIWEDDRSAGREGRQGWH